jgi:hypothetical protein
MLWCWFHFETKWYVSFREYIFVRLIILYMCKLIIYKKTVHFLFFSLGKALIIAFLICVTVWKWLIKGAEIFSHRLFIFTSKLSNERSKISLIVASSYISWTIILLLNSTNELHFKIQRLSKFFMYSTYTVKYPYKDLSNGTISGQSWKKTFDFFDGN